MPDSDRTKPGASNSPYAVGKPVPIQRPQRRRVTKTFGLSMGDLLGLLDISEDSIANAASSRSETGVVLVSHEQCGNLFLAIGMRIQCDHGVAEITELNDQDATITPLATKSATTLPIADLVFQEGFEILDHQ